MAVEYGKAAVQHRHILPVELMDMEFVQLHPAWVHGLKPLFVESLPTEGVEAGYLAE